MKGLYFEVKAYAIFFGMLKREHAKFSDAVSAEALRGNGLIDLPLFQCIRSHPCLRVVYFTE